MEVIVHSFKARDKMKQEIDPPHSLFRALWEILPADPYHRTMARVRNVNIEKAIPSDKQIESRNQHTTPYEILRTHVG